MAMVAVWWEGFVVQSWPGMEEQRRNIDDESGDEEEDKLACEVG